MEYLYPYLHFIFNYLHDWKILKPIIAESSLLVGSQQTITLKSHLRMVHVPHDDDYILCQYIRMVHVPHDDE